MAWSCLLAITCFALVTAALSVETEGPMHGVGRELMQGSDYGAYGPGAISAACEVIPGIDFHGGDMFGGISTSSNARCCQLCSSMPSCIGWTRTKNKQCWLKSKLNTPTVCKDCSASGFISIKITPLSDVRSKLQRLRSAKKTPLRVKAAINTYLAKNLGDYGK